MQKFYHFFRCVQIFLISLMGAGFWRMICHRFGSKTLQNCSTVLIKEVSSVPFILRAAAGLLETEVSNIQVRV